MTTKELGQLVVKMCDKLKETLTSKGIEYSIEDDRLINFRNAGAMNNQTPKQALWGMVTKHIIALHDFIEREANRIEVPEEQWDEKIIDIICYMVLLKALRSEDASNEPVDSDLEGYVIYDAYMQGCVSKDLESVTDWKEDVAIFGTGEAALQDIDISEGEGEEVMTLNDAIKKGILQ